MKIMYLTAEGFDTPNPNNQLALTMLDDFLKAGIEVYLLQSHKKGVYRDIPELLEGRKGFTSDTILRPIIDKNNFVRRYIDELKYLWKSSKIWRKHKEIDVVLLQSNPTSVFYILFLKLLLKKRIIYNVFDIFPGSAYDIGVMKQRWMYNILNFVQRLAYKLSDAIVVPGDDMKINLEKQKVNREKITVIPNWYDDQSVREVAPAENRFFLENDITKGQKFIVQFAGTLGYVLDFATILNVAKILENHKDIEFHIIGDGNMRDEYYQMVENYRLKNVRLFPWQRLEIIQDVYSACDICLIPLKKGVIGTGFPSKATLLMACKRVVMFSIPKDTIFFSTVSDNHIGIAMDSGDYQAIAEKIVYLKENPKELQTIAEKAQAFADKYYSRKSNTPQFIKLINKMVDRRENV